MGSVARARRPQAVLLVAVLPVVLSACQARQADVATNTISAAQPTTLHQQSNTAITTVGLAARDAGCKSPLGGRPVSACKWFFKVRLTNAAGVAAVVPAGADTNALNAYPKGSTTGVGPTQTFPVVEASDKISLQQQVSYQTQGCAWVDFGDNPPGFEGPFCGGSDGNGDGVADLGSWGPAWLTQPDPAAFNVFRFNGLMVHWRDTSTERHVDVANCISSTLLANNPGLATGFAELSQFNVPGRILVRNQSCPGGVAPATTEIRAFNQNSGATNVVGQALFSWYTADGHIVYNDPANAPNPTFVVNDFYVNQLSNAHDEMLVKHELGHAIGLAHDDRTDPVTLGPKIMRPVLFGTPTEVDPWERSTLSFLYNHTDSFDGNSGDSTAPAGAAADPPAYDPDAKKLRQGGKGAKVRKRYGDREVLELTNRGNGVVGAKITVYASEAAASEAAGG